MIKSDCKFIKKFIIRFEIYSERDPVKRQRKREKVQAVRKRFAHADVSTRRTAREIELAFLVTPLCARTNELTAIGNREVR